MLHLKKQCPEALQGKRDNFFVTAPISDLKRGKFAHVHGASVSHLSLAKQKQKLPDIFKRAEAPDSNRRQQRAKAAARDSSSASSVLRFIVERNTVAFLDYTIALTYSFPEAESIRDGMKSCSVKLGSQVPMM